MARSEDPTTYSQTWNEPQQGYAPAEPTPQAHGYAPQAPQPYAPQQGQAPQTGYAQDPYAQAAPQYATDQQYAPQPTQAAEAYPPLDLGAASYDTAAQYQQPAAAADPYAGYEQPAEVAQQSYAQPQSYQQPQSYHEPHSYQQPAQDAFEQPVSYQQEPATQPTHSYAPQPQQTQHYAEANAPQDYAAVGTQQPQGAVVYSEYTPQAPEAQMYAEPEQQAPTANTPFADFSQQREPTLDAARQDYGQPQYADAGHAFGDAGGQTQPASYAQQQPADSFLDTSLFAQPEPGHQPPAFGGQQFESVNPLGQNTLDPYAAQQANFQQPAGYDQRFEPQPQGYDQRFEQPEQNHYDGGLIGDMAPHEGHEMSPDMGAVVADQQVEKSRGRRGLIVVGALVAAVGIGGALGFAYKYSNDSGVKVAGDPPMIKANKAPSKVKPSNANGGSSFSSDDLGTRLQTNRAATRSTTRVVSREEPVGGQQGGVSLRSSTSGQTNTGGTRVSSLQDRAKNVPGVRRVKTLKVNPDGTFAAPSNRLTSNDALSIQGITMGGNIPAAAPTKSKRISVEDALANNSQAARQKIAESLPKARTQAAIPQPRPVTKRKQVASLTPTAPATASSGGGLGYVVQVSARRSRIDALAAFADLQQRYTGALSAKQPDIQEVNLGSRGKWYRVRIGPPGSKNAAYNLCNRLKKSGLKDCIIKAY